MPPKEFGCNIVKERRECEESAGDGEPALDILHALTCENLLLTH